MKNLINELLFFKEKLYNGIFGNRVGCFDKAIECIEKYEEYKQLEEQGLLVKLQLKVGDTVIWDDNLGKSNNPQEYTITGYSFGEAEDYIDEPVVTDELVYYCVNSTGSITGSFAASEIGKSIFLKK